MVFGKHPWYRHHWMKLPLEHIGSKLEKSEDQVEGEIDKFA